LRVSALTALDGDDFISTDRDRIVHEREVARPTLELPRGMVVGEYEIERKIGEGGMGAVYAAVHPVLGKRVAIKIIGDEVSCDAAAIARFRREARVVAHLASPHIVDVFGFGELADGRAYFVMDYLSGESLRDRLGRGRVPLDEALEILDQIVRGLETAHEAGVVHRDLKPENIFIERGRGSTGMTVKLLDFGIVKLEKHDEDIAKTQAGVLIGTPMYVAPEQIRSAGEVDHRADVYALGGVAFELVVGRVPFVRTTVVELVAAHLECTAPRGNTVWPEIPPALDAVLAAMLAKDPAKRPTLGYVQEAIEKLRRSAFATPPVVAPVIAAAPAARPPVMMESLPAQRHAAAISVPPRPTPRRHRRVVAIAGGSVFVIAATVVFAGIHSSAEVGVRASAPSAPVAARLRVSPIEGAAPIAPPPPTHEPAAATREPPTEKPPAAIAATVEKPPRRTTTTPTSPTTTTAPTPPPTTGELAISSKPPCEVSIDGKPTGRRTPIPALSVEGGIHRVTLDNAQLGIDETVYVQVIPGKQARVVEDYSARLHVDPNGTIDPFRGSGR
jgi:serine/threonine-protein kinase